jgi:hypothetical protein
VVSITRIIEIKNVVFNSMKTENVLIPTAAPIKREIFRKCCFSDFRILSLESAFFRKSR